MSDRVTVDAAGRPRVVGQLVSADPDKHKRQVARLKELGGSAADVRELVRHHKALRQRAETCPTTNSSAKKTGAKKKTTGAKKKTTAEPRATRSQERMWSGWW